MTATTVRKGSNSDSLGPVCSHDTVVVGFCPLLAGAKAELARFSCDVVWQQEVEQSLGWFSETRDNRQV